MSYSGTLANELQFTGKEWDADEGLYYYGARYYDPEIGRFYAVDPLGSAASSPYMYCGNNPISYNDPSGMAMSSVGKYDRDMMAPFAGYSLNINNWDLPPAPGQAAGPNQGLNSGTTQVYGTDVNYWYYTSSLQDASGNNFSTQNYAAGVAAREYLAFLAYASTVWNASQTVDLSGLEGRTNWRMPMSNNGFSLKYDGKISGVKSIGTLTLYGNWGPIGSWDAVSGSNNKPLPSCPSWETTVGSPVLDNREPYCWDGYDWGWFAEFNEQPFGRTDIGIHPDGWPSPATAGCIGIQGQAVGLYYLLQRYEMPIGITVR